MLIAARTDHCALRAAVSAITNIFYTISADIAIVTPAAVSHTSLTQFTVRTKSTGAVSTLLVTTFTYDGTI